MNPLSHYGPRSLRHLLGYLWAAPVTAVGLGLALLALASGGRLRCQQGVVEASGGVVRWLLRGNRFWRGGAALTLGHVILARDQECLERSRQHEYVHVRQYERWGVFLWPAYLLIGWRLARKGYHPYLDHPFEKEADGSEHRSR